MKKNSFSVRKLTSSPIARWIGIAMLLAVTVFVLRNAFLETSDTRQVTPLLKITPAPISATPSAQVTHVPTNTPAPLVSPTTVPVTQKYIDITGFTYEDTNQDNQYNNGEPHLNYMHLRYFDTKYPSTVFDMYSNADGSYEIKLSVWGNLTIIPSTNLNYLPVTNQQTFSNSATNVLFGFRTSGSVNIPNSGSIQGDVFQDANHNSSRDAGESGVYFYKLYLKDSQGNIYNTSANTEATDQNGHFAYDHLPLGTYTLILSNPTGAYLIEQSNVSISVTSSNPNVTNVEVPVVKN